MKEEVLTNIIMVIFVLVCVAVLSFVGIPKEVCLIFAFSTAYFCYLHLEIRLLKQNLLEKTLLEISISVQDEVNKIIDNSIRDQVKEHISKGTRITDHRIDLGQDKNDK